MASTLFHAYWPDHTSAYSVWCIQRSLYGRCSDQVKPVRCWNTLHRRDTAGLPSASNYSRLMMFGSQCSVSASAPGLRRVPCSINRGSRFIGTRYPNMRLNSAHSREETWIIVTERGRVIEIVPGNRRADHTLCNVIGAFSDWFIWPTALSTKDTLINGALVRATSNGLNALHRLWSLITHHSLLIG